MIYIKTSPVITIFISVILLIALTGCLPGENNGINVTDVSLSASIGGTGNTNYVIMPDGRIEAITKGTTIIIAEAKDGTRKYDFITVTDEETVSDRNHADDPMPGLLAALNSYTSNLVRIQGE